MSIYYPIVRSSPIAIVIFSWLILGEKYTSLSVIAILVIFAGAIMLQNSEPGFLGKKKALALAFMAMAGSASYSISDAIAVQKVNPSTLLFYCYILVSLFLFLNFIISLISLVISVSGINFENSVTKIFSGAFLT